MPLSCYKFTVNHGFTGLIALFYQTFIELMLSFIEDIADIAITIVID